MFTCVLFFDLPHGEEDNQPDDNIQDGVDAGHDLVHDNLCVVLCCCFFGHCDNELSQRCDAEQRNDDKSWNKEPCFSYLDTKDEAGGDDHANNVEDDEEHIDGDGLGSLHRDIQPCHRIHNICWTGSFPD